MKTTKILSIVMAGMLSAGAVFAQSADPGMAWCGMMPGMGGRKAEIMEWHQKMVEKIKAQDAEMDKLVAEMNAAAPEKKTDAIAAIINKMMENRKAWHSEMEARHKKMMEAMKEQPAAKEQPATQEQPATGKKKAKKAE